MNKSICLIICLLLSMNLGKNACAETVEEKASIKEVIVPCPTLEEIKKRGRLIIGTYEDEPYFSYFNSVTNKLEGFDIDLAEELAQEILGDSKKVEFLILTPKNRIPFLQQGKVDLILAELTINDERKKLVDFSKIYYMAGQSILVKVNSPIQSLEELNKERVIGVVSGSTNALNIKKALPKASLAFFESIAQAFEALTNGQVDAMGIDDVMLFALKKNNQEFLRGYKFIGGEISWEAYGIGIKKGCGDLLKAVNEALQTIESDGRWERIYDTHIKPVSHVSAKPPL